MGDNEVEKRSGPSNDDDFIRHSVAIVNYLPDATFVIDNRHQVVAWNPAMVELTGVEARDVVGKGDYEHALAFYGLRRPMLADLILAPDEEFEKNLQIARENGALITETLAPSLRGKPAFLWGKATLFYDSQGKVVGAIESIRDITERKKAEMDLINSERRLADIINFLPDPTFVIDSSHRVIAWNLAMEEMTGVKAEQILGQGDYQHGAAIYGCKRPIMADLILEPDEELENTYSFVKREKGTLIMENPTSHLMGKETYLWGKATLLYDSQGYVTGAIESIRDITERKQAEADLRNSEQRLADIIDFLPDPTFVVDKEHRVIAWNRAVEEMTGVKAQDILGKGNYEHGIPFYGTRRPTLIDRILEPDEEMEKHYSLIIERDKEVLIVETPALMVKGKETYLWGKSSLLYDSGGTVIGAVESIRDVTERKQAEMALRNSEQRLADIIDFLPDATFVIDKEHKVIAWNRAMEEMSGVKAQDILGKGDYEHGIPFYGTRRPTLIDRILEPDEEMEKHYSLIIERDKEVLIVETPALMVKGKETYLWGKASLLYDSQGTVIGAIESIRDVTERKKTELDKLEAQERAARAENLASLGLMTTGLAHAIKQPLNSLMVTIDSILYWYDQGQDLARGDLIEDLQKALIKASRINEIIEHMRSFIRNERYGELTPCNMNLAVENALDILKVQLTAHRVKVRLELDPYLPLVLGYENRMEEIIINLMVNAMQSLDRVADPVEKVINCISRVDHNVILEICDNGIGVSPENMSKIFEPFFSTKEGQGMGMGLFIAKSIITTLNGSIVCESDQRRTTFRIELPSYRA